MCCWTREAEVQSLDTPERRAAFERRLQEAVREIKDETLRRYYQQEISERLKTAFGGNAGGARRRDGQPWRPPGAWQPGGAGRGRFNKDAPRVGYAGTPTAPSANLGRSALFQSARTVVPPREALVVLILLNHPGLLAKHIEDMAGLELTSPEAAKFRDFLLNRPISSATAGNAAFQGNRGRFWPAHPACRGDGGARLALVGQAGSGGSRRRSGVAAGSDLASAGPRLT